MLQLRAIWMASFDKSTVELFATISEHQSQRLLRYGNPLKSCTLLLQSVTFTAAGSADITKMKKRLENGRTCLRALCRAATGRCHKKAAQKMMKKTASQQCSKSNQRIRGETHNAHQSH